MTKAVSATLAAALLLAGCATIPASEKALVAAPIDCTRAGDQIAELRAIRPGPGRQIQATAATLGVVGLAVGAATNDLEDRAEVASGRQGERIDARIAEIREMCGVG